VLLKTNRPYDDECIRRDVCGLTGIGSVKLKIDYISPSTSTSLIVYQKHNPGH